MLSKKQLLIIVSLIILVIGISSTAQAGTSVYVISNINGKEIQAYKVDANSLTYQIDYTTTYDSPVGLAVSGSGFLFVTFEFSNMIEIINAKTMRPVDTVPVPNVVGRGLAGIAADSTNSRVYVMNRYTNHLYSYSWDPLTKTLAPDFPDPYYIELQDIVWNGSSIGAFGIALDEANSRLYVADNNNTVKYYDSNDPNWSKLSQLTLSCQVISIAVDVNNQFLYAGSMGTYGEGDPNLYQYNISTETENAVTVGSSVAGIAVDQASSLVYITTYGDGGSGTQDKLFVYDPNLTQQWVSDDIGNPAGVAVASGVSYKAPSFSLVKDNNDPNDECVEPFDESLENYLVYDISWDANGYADSNVVVVDYLPFEVDEPNWISDGGVYDANTHTVKWVLNDIGANDSNEFQIRVGVNYWARPGGTFTNLVIMESDTYFNETTKDVNVCCWGSEIIYVDKDANDPNSFRNGSSWENAYTDLQDALLTAQTYDCYSAIWVAAGTYKPVEDINVLEYEFISFELLGGVGLLGHFAGTESNPDQRNFADANNTTTLEGQIGQGEWDKVQYVVKAQYITGPNSVIDGFTIQNSANYYGPASIYLYNADVSIVNCKLKSNEMYGIFAANNPLADIHNCIFIDNGYSGVCLVTSQGASQLDISYSIFDGNSITKQGIKSAGSGSSINIMNSVFKNHTGDGIYCYPSDLTLENSVIRYNGGDGIELRYSPNTTIINNWIHDNDNAGIYFYNPSSAPLVRNNTIYNNSAYGIELDSGADPNILNCIIWNNGDDLYNCNATYSCIEDGDAGTGNISSDPCFYDAENDNYHLKGDSNCVDAGTGTYSNETDIDGEPRTADANTDMGADEYYWPKADYNRDEKLNFIDYTQLAEVWLGTDPNISLDDDNDVDIDDLDLFCADWLWQSAWGQTPLPLRGGGGTDGSLMLPTAAASLQAMPERLAAKTRKFYDIIPANTVSALRRAEEAKYVEVQEAKHVEVQEAKYVEVNEDAIKELIDWLDEIWLNGEIDWTEEKFLEFRKSVEESGF